MATRKLIVQKIKKTTSTSVGVAKKYYAAVMALNEVNLSGMELNVLAYAAVKGNISFGGAMQDFREIFDTTEASVRNCVYRMIKRKLLVRRAKRICVNPSILLDFEKDVLLQIQISYEQ